MAALALDKLPAANDRATLGKHCWQCQFRPWCEPFWQANIDQVAVFPFGDGNLESISFEGCVIEVRSYGTDTQLFYQATIQVDGDGVRVETEIDKHGHISSLRAGVPVRVLDGIGRSGEKPLVVKLGRWSEIYEVAKQATEYVA